MDKKFVVTIGREFGTGGRQIAVELANMLGVELYDKGLLRQLEERYNLTQEEIDKLTRYITRKDKDNTDTRIKGLEERMAQLRPLISEKEAAELDAIIAECKADNARLNAAKQEEKEKKAAEKKAAKEAAKAEAKKETKKADTKA